MPEIGQTLSHFRIVEKIGQGGMGEVYLADDTTLDRKVALKFLPEAFTSDPERMARFEREAKLLASLNHPNIAGIYGLEQADGTRFLVLEYVEGETLQARLSKGALPLEDALALCRQIAEGLEAAHEKGVIHRDLKPANVMITADEKVKILDFGLAKAFANEQSDLNLSNSPTLSLAATQQGIILGTAGYMSPEQARGKSVDKRVDIWAFGVILYEMLTGKQLFKGETVSDTMASVLTQEPDFNIVPSKVRPLLKRCLVKDPKLRLRDVSDTTAMLEATSETEGDSTALKTSRAIWIYAAVATILIIILAIPTYRYLNEIRTTPLGHYQLTVPPMSDDHTLAISPDGRWVAFVATSSNSSDLLYLRDRELLEPKPIIGTEGASYPFWSPDNKSVGFFQQGRLKSVDISNGSIRDICQAPYTLFSPGSWNDKGDIIFPNPFVMHRVSKEGGEPTPITVLNESLAEMAHFQPHFLPDGRHYLYATSVSTGTGDIYLGSLDSESPKKILDNAMTPVYVEPGYLLFQREDTLFARSFDIGNFEVSGEPIRIVEKLLRNNRGNATFSASQNGLLIYRNSSDQSGSHFVQYDRNGNQTDTFGKPAPYSPGFRLSPNGNQLAATLFDPVINTYGVWIIDCEHDVPSTILCSDAKCILPAWSPDGLEIAYSSSRKGNYDIFRKNLDNTGEELIVVDSPGEDYLKDWSRDGRYIAYAVLSETTLYAMPLKGDKKPVSIIESSFGLNTPAYSFDGEWVAFPSNESGMWQIYVIHFPKDGHTKKPISINGGVQPRWRKDGKELYYLSLDGKMMAVEITLGSDIKIGKQTELFDTGLNIHPDDYQYDVTDDGRKFVVLKPIVAETHTSVPIFINWTSLLDK